MDHVQAVVVGAGAIGLAVARALALQGHEVVVLEAEGAFGTQTSSRNSEVIHAGLYYPTDSLKAYLCVQGRDALYEYCADRGVAHQRCGKWLVATREEEIPALQAIQAQAHANGVSVDWVEAAHAMEAEPELRCVAALYSPLTGIVDSHAYMLSLLGDLEHAGGVLALRSRLYSADVTGSQKILTLGDGSQLSCDVLVNAAGLSAVAVAQRMEGLDPSLLPQAHFAKGQYFALAGRSPFKSLVYPVPEPGGLGIHFTLDLGGQGKFGPDVQWVEGPDDLSVDPRAAQRFAASIRRYWPGLPEDALQPAYAGIRPKIHGPEVTSADFVLQGPTSHGIENLYNLLGVESPGLTASLALAQVVCDGLSSG